MKKQSVRFYTAATAAAFLLAIFSTPLSAQVVVNPKVGANFSGVESQLGDITAEARVGWNAGVDFRIGEKALFFQPGLHFYNFTARLVDQVERPDDISFREETTIQSLKAPVNIGLRLTGDNGLLGIHVKGGVMPSYIVGVKEEAGYGFDKSDLNTFTWGANVGVGVDVLFLTIDANYEIGLDDFFAQAAGANNMLTVSMGLKF